MTTSPTGRTPGPDPFTELCIGCRRDERMAPAFRPAKNVPEVTIQETAPANPGKNESTSATLSIDWMSEKTAADLKASGPWTDFSAIEARILGGMKPGEVLIFMAGRMPGRNSIRDAMSALAHAGGDASDRMLKAVKALEEKGNLEPLRNLAEEHVLLFGNGGLPDLKAKVEAYRRLYSLGHDKGPVTHEELQGLMSMNKRLNDTEMATPQTDEAVEPIIVPGGAHKKKKKAKAQWKNEKRGGYFKR